MLNEVNDLAGQHEVVAEQLADSVASDISAVVKELKDERKRVSRLGGKGSSRTYSQLYVRVFFFCKRGMSGKHKGGSRCSVAGRLWCQAILVIHGEP